MSDLMNAASTSSNVVNDNPETLIGGATSPNQTNPTYGVDKDAPIEKSDGTMTTLGATMDDVDALKKQTVKLAADGSTFTGDVSSAQVTFQNASQQKQTALVGEQFQSLVQFQSSTAESLAALTTRSSRLSADGTTYSGDVSGATGSVKAQTAPAALTAAPTADDFNNLVAQLKSAGVLK